MNGKQIRRARRALDLTQGQLAQMANVSQAVVSILENEQRLEKYRAQLAAALERAQAEDRQPQPQAA